MTNITLSLSHSMQSSYGTLLRRMDQAKHYKIIYGAKLVCMGKSYIVVVGL